jgi:hypothetical protein
MYFKDVIEFKGKHATIMRDGVYLYMPSEIGITDGRDPNKPVQVFRPASEVIKAYNRFKELGHLPVTLRHPDQFLDHSVTETWENGEGKNPELKTDVFYTVLDCVVDIKNDSIKDYQNGTRQLSCGWSGEFKKAESGPYEYLQLFGDINHIAIVPNGRCGDICKINDRGLKMKIADILKSIFTSKKVEISDEDLKEYEKQLDEAYEGKETPEEEKEEEKMKDKKKKKTKDEEKEKEKETEDEDEGEEKKTEDKKKKNKDKAIEDKAINDAYQKGVKETQELFKKSMNDVLPILSEFQPDDIKDKTPCEIKALFVKKVTDTQIETTDAGLDIAFKMAMKNYQHPAYRNGLHTEDMTQKSIADEMNKMTFNVDNKNQEVK